MNALPTITHRMVVGFAFLLFAALLTACIAPQSTLATPDASNQQATPQATPEVTHAMMTALIHQQLDAGKTIVEIAPVKRLLPEDLDIGQLGGYFRLGTLDFALAMQPSVNVPLDLPQDHITTFAGVLVSLDGKSWKKYLEIHDKVNTDKDNPYYLWTDAGDLFLSVVDQTGGGSGEGVMKLEKLSAADSWDLVQCYDFGQSYRGPSLDGDYFAFSQEIAKQKRRSLAVCQNVDLLYSQ